ncbi:MAG: mevalonate kinase, partial [Fimbriimonadaceae bacterium]|nr:mevalonate kinase [Chitinophagales bacterium]
MQVSESRIYPAKLLLFGEYAILSGNDALAIPYPEYYATWIKATPKNYKFISLIEPFILYLHQRFPFDFDFNKLKADINEGFCLESSIPYGYGLGSSATCVAAIYDLYCTNKINDRNLAELQEYLGKMENYFHSKSSGFDPLVVHL